MKDKVLVAALLICAFIAGFLTAALALEAGEHASRSRRNLFGCGRYQFYAVRLSSGTYCQLRGDTQSGELRRIYITDVVE